MNGFSIRVLGAAAGGGLPQWNCGCANCIAARAGTIPGLSQSSIIASASAQAARYPDFERSSHEWRH